MESIKRLISWYFNTDTRILNEDILILILDYLPFEQIIELKKVSPQFSDCVKEFLKRKMYLVVCKNPQAFRSMFYTYHKYSIEQKKEILKNFVIPLEQMERKETNKCLKYVYKRCIHLNALAINCQIKGIRINTWKKIHEKNRHLMFGLFISLSPEYFELGETQIEKIGNIFGNSIRCLCLKFSIKDINATQKLIAILIKFSKLEEIKVILKNCSIDTVLQYIPKTIKVLDLFSGCS